MVKSGGGGTKRKIDKMEKIPKREYRATTFSKRCSGLYSKAAQLCLLADAQIAILATPPSSQSNVSFFSFGHSSVDAVVNAYLTGQRLAPELGLELWWEKESLCESKDPRELMDAVKAMERMLSKLRSGDFVSDEEDLIKSSEIMAKSDVVLHQGTQEPDETLDIQAVCCVPGDDLPHEGFDKITEVQDQILALCATDNNINGLSGSGLDVYSQEVDIDELIDWTTFESSVFDDGVLDSTQEHQGSLLMNFEAAAHDVSTNPNPPMSVSEVEEEGFVFQNSVLDEDNLQFRDYFN
ncbi:hypothetical protein HID58_023600 [Brassica napus]|uniref:MADS-box domain-containing protein n=1 Tax=Brassica napus TaxID=3708 RepID=A0ABQ8D2J4_BRANA|nr:hypothetical protein HID58_023600 [Brassica napus]